MQGDDYVDWVGMNVYHFGQNMPWGRNQLPEDQKLDSFITGTYQMPGETSYTLRRLEPLLQLQHLWLLYPQQLQGSACAGRHKAQALLPAPAMKATACRECAQGLRCKAACLECRCPCCQQTQLLQDIRREQESAHGHC